MSWFRYSQRLQASVPGGALATFRPPRPVPAGGRTATAQVAPQPLSAGREAALPTPGSGTGLIAALVNVPNNVSKCQAYFLVRAPPRRAAGG